MPLGPVPARTPSLAPAAIVATALRRSSPTSSPTSRRRSCACHRLTAARTPGRQLGGARRPVRTSRAGARLELSAHVACRACHTLTGPDWGLATAPSPIAPARNRIGRACDRLSRRVSALIAEVGQDAFERGDDFLAFDLAFAKAHGQREVLVLRLVVERECLRAARLWALRWPCGHPRGWRRRRRRSSPRARPFSAGQTA